MILLAFNLALFDPKPVIFDFNLQTSFSPNACGSSGPDNLPREIWKLASDDTGVSVSRAYDKKSRPEVNRYNWQGKLISSKFPRYWTEISSFRNNVLEWIRKKDGLELIGDPKKKLFCMDGKVAGFCDTKDGLLIETAYEGKLYRFTGAEIQPLSATIAEGYSPLQVTFRNAFASSESRGIYRQGLCFSDSFEISHLVSRRSFVVVTKANTQVWIDNSTLRIMRPNSTAIEEIQTPGIVPDQIETATPNGWIAFTARRIENHKTSDYKSLFAFKVDP